MAKLSVLIAARNELWLNNTIEDVLKNRRGDTEVIVALDGAWPNEPIRDHPDVHILFHPVSVGQRAAVNDAARLSRADFIMKADAHCAFDEGFDVKLLTPYETGELSRTDTTIPRLYNLWVFDWVCKKCGEHRYQGPTQATCGKCGGVDTQERQLVWKPRLHKLSDFMRFDNRMVFGYWRSYKDRPQAQGELCEVMGGLGACFLMRRDRYWELGGLDEGHGSWGQMGTEISCKSWLSGGRQMVNKRGWFSHLFRTQGGDFSFPYHISNGDVERARSYSQDLWLNNKWPGQVRPLAWLIDRFWPVPVWSDAEGAETLRHVREAAAKFVSPSARASQVLVPMGEIVRPLDGLRADGTGPGHSSDLGRQRMPSVAEQARGMGLDVTLPDTDGAGPHPAPSGLDLMRRGQQVSPDAVGLAPINSGSAVGSGKVLSVGDELQVRGIAAPPVLAGVVDHRDGLTATARQRVDEPREHEAVSQFVSSTEGCPDAAVASALAEAKPLPAASLPVHADLVKDASQLFAIQVGDAKVGVSHDSALHAELRLEAVSRSQRDPASSIVSPNPPSAILYYTDNRLDPYLLGVCQRQLRRAAGDIPIYCVSLAPMDFGDVRIVLPLQRGHLTMFKQQLAGLEAMDSRIENVYFIEHDCLMPPEHFDLTPESHSCFYYNKSNWRVDYETGRALFFLAFAVSGLVAHRELLIEHYRKRVARVEAAGRYERCIGYEPGCHKPPRGIDNYPALTLRSDVPYIDIRHNRNLSKTRWSQDQFRDKRTCQGWTESDRVPGWGITQGRMRDFLADVDRGDLRRVA